MPAKRIIAPELLAKARHLYEETSTPIEEICVVMDASRSVFYRCQREEKWVRRRYGSDQGMSAEAAAADPVVRLATASAAVRAEAGRDGGAETDAATPVTPEERAALSARVFRAAQVQMTTIETVMQSFRPTGSEPPSERTVRIIAALNKSLREISTMLGRDQTPPHEADNDPVPRDIDEFRRELARRIRSFIEARRARAAGFPDGPGNPLA